LQVAAAFARNLAPVAQKFVYFLEERFRKTLNQDCLKTTIVKAHILKKVETTLMENAYNAKNLYSVRRFGIDFTMERLREGDRYKSRH